MKIKLYKILSILSIIVFTSYWSVGFIAALANVKSKNSVVRRINLPKTSFISEWKLFTPPSTDDQRLYYILRDVNKTSIADTIEVLENVSIQKQIKAPFNQKELIIDYLLNKNIVRLSRMGWVINKKSIPDSSNMNASENRAPSMAMIENIKNYQMYLLSLLNYGKIILKEQTINTDGKEMRIVIKQKIIKPFKEMQNTNIERTETTIFESPYLPLK